MARSSGDRSACAAGSRQAGSVRSEVLHAIPAQEPCIRGGCGCVTVAVRPFVQVTIVPCVPSIADGSGIQADAEAFSRTHEERTRFSLADQRECSEGHNDIVRFWGNRARLIDSTTRRDAFNESDCWEATRKTGLSDKLT